MRKYLYYSYLLLSLIVILLITFLIYNYNKEQEKVILNNNDIISKYLSNSYVTTLVNCKKSNERVNTLIKAHLDNKLPMPKINPALHGNNDIDYIKNNYPNINHNSYKFKNRRGAYGLTASFIQFLKKNKNNSYSMWYEDDALPTINYNFIVEMKKALNNLPKKGNDVYYFGFTNYCRTECDKSEKKWNKKNNNSSGSHAILFTRESVNTILNYYYFNKINIPIDNLLDLLNNKKYINSWYISGYKSYTDHMICGLFYQDKTYCHKRENILDNEMGGKRV